MSFAGRMSPVGPVGPVAFIDFLIEDSPIEESACSKDLQKLGDFDVFEDSASLKEFLIFRVDALDDLSPYHRELADESALESEASNFAQLLDASESESGIHYEVRSAGTGALVHTTEYDEALAAGIGERAGQRKETTCPAHKRKKKHKSNTAQPDQLRMAIS